MKYNLFLFVFIKVIQRIRNLFNRIIVIGLNILFYCFSWTNQVWIRYLRTLTPARTHSTDGLQHWKSGKGFATQEVYSMPSISTVTKHWSEARGSCVTLTSLTLSTCTRLSGPSSALRGSFCRWWIKIYLRTIAWFYLWCISYI